MLTAAIEGPRTASLREIAEPARRDGWVKVNVTLAPLCTEFGAYAAGSVGHSLGHEAVGVVADADPTSALRVGDSVIAMPLLGCGACTLCVAGDYIHCSRGIDGEEPLGTIRQTIVKPERLLVPVPEGLTDEEASLACCALGASFGAFERVQVSAADTLLVTGLGPVGLGAVVHGAMRGCRVIAVDTNPYRSALASDLGADVVMAPSDDTAALIKDLCGGSGPDLALECSGVVSAQRICIDSVRRRGSVGFIGNSFGETSLTVSTDLIFTGITMFGSWHYNLASAPRLLTLIARHRSLVSRLVTHRFPLSRIGDAWDTQLTGQCGKVLIEMPR